MEQKNFKEIMDIVWHSACLCYGAAYNSWQFCNEEAEKYRTLKQQAVKNSQEAKNYGHLMNRWADLRTRCNWFMNFIVSGYGGYDKGVHKMMIGIYKAINEDPNTLEDFHQYENKGILTPLSFTEEPTSDIKELEASFVSDDSYIRNDADGMQAQLRRTSEILLTSIYRLIGTGLWADSVINREENVGDWTLALNIWGILLEGSRNFLYYGRNCLADTEISSKIFFDNLTLSREEMFDFDIEVRTKYIKHNEDNNMCVGGLYMITYDQLPQEWKDKAEYSKPINW